MATTAITTRVRLSTFPPVCVPHYIVEKSLKTIAVFDLISVVSTNKLCQNWIDTIQVM